MSFGSILGTLLIGPLKLVFEFIFQFGMLLTNHPGLSIIFLSLAMNVLVLPLYRRADAMQEQSRDVENKLRDGVAHIKKTFSGDERMMILQAYYRQNNYKPTDVLNGSVSLLLEIPFFMAAYQFLSHLEPLNGVSFGPIADLGAPDGLLTIAGFTINLLPVIMTVINVVSSAIYLKGFPLKTKIQLYGMAAFFLVFLWTSPAGLVFYWTLNNVFSLVKNIFYKIKNPKLVLNVLMLLSGTAAVLLGTFGGSVGLNVPAKPIVLIGLILVIPPVISIIKANVKTKPKMAKREVKPSRAMFILGALFLTIFIGAFIPSNFIADSPQEFVDLTNFYHPLNYVLYSLCMAAGTFLVWCGVFYWLANDKWKKVFEYAVVALSVIFTVNYMFFGTKLGIISSALRYDDGLIFAAKEKLINLAVVAIIALAVYFIVFKLSRAAKAVVLTAAIALGVMSGLNVFTIRDSVDAIKVTDAEDFPKFEFSRDGKNVVVIMLDRAMNEYIPYLFAEKPELYEMFDGFTYYSNTISFGGHTNFGAPPMMGGYEYTPVEMNKRDRESLKDKHNESIKVMPYLFDDNGYNVTLCDVPYANYSYIPDMSIYDERPNIKTYMTEGIFGTTSDEYREYSIDSQSRNFFCFSMMKSLPVALQNLIYDDGLYHQAYVPAWGSVLQSVEDNLSKAEGLNKNFMEPYEVLNNLDVMTSVTEDGENNFLFLYNDAPHEPMLLQTPDYVPSEVIDNTDYDKAHKDRYELENGDKINVTDYRQTIHYHANMGSLLRLGEWFDYLREQGVYDNTKIILAADHGYYLYQFDDLMYEGVLWNTCDISNYYPLLMVKDFDSVGFKTSEEFMTNADVPTLAFDGAIENPVNPFTGKPINMDEKTAHDQFVILSRDWDTAVNNGNQFTTSKWAAVSSNLWDREDWEFITDYVVLTEHKLPD